MGQPNNNLIWGILVTVLCCLPLGIVSIVKSTQVSGLWAQGRAAEAQQAADDAKKYAVWGAIAGVIVFVIVVIINIVVGVSATSNLLLASSTIGRRLRQWRFDAVSKIGPATTCGNNQSH